MLNASAQGDQLHRVYEQLGWRISQEQLSCRKSIGPIRGKMRQVKVLAVRLRVHRVYLIATPITASQLHQEDQYSLMWV